MLGCVAIEKYVSVKCMFKFEFKAEKSAIKNKICSTKTDFGDWSIISSQLMICLWVTFYWTSVTKGLILQILNVIL